MGLVFNVHPGDVFWAASDVGWVVGHSYIVYGPLLHGCSTVLYEGKPIGTPDAGAFWRVCQEYNVRVLSTAPTALRALKREDPHGKFIQKYPMPNLQALFLAGERCDPDSLVWAQSVLGGRPVIDNWWMTELGSVATGLAQSLQTPTARPGSCGLQMPGFNFALLDEKGVEISSPLDPSFTPPATTTPVAMAASKPTVNLQADHMSDYEIDDTSLSSSAYASGSIAIKLPLPPGTFPTLWNNDAGFIKSYMERFPGYFDTGDAGTVDRDGFLSVMSRADDIINVAGHRLSTGTLEEVLSAMPEVAECAVVGTRDKLKGMRPFGFVVLKAGVLASEDQIVEQAIASIRQHVGAFACFDRCIVVPRVPKTRSGKVLRRVLRSIVNSDEYEVPATIDDPSVLPEIAAIFASHYPSPAK